TRRRVPPTFMEVFGVAVVTKNVDVAGRRISIETGRVAEQANGAVIVRQGDTVALSTAVMSKEPREGIDSFPLTCEYEEKLDGARWSRRVWRRSRPARPRPRNAAEGRLAAGPAGRWHSRRDPDGRGRPERSDRAGRTRRCRRCARRCPADLRTAARAGPPGRS